MTSIRETANKSLIYARDTYAYWQLTDDATPLAVRTGPLRLYPLDIRPRLASGHFNRFDAAGLPIRRSRQGWIHNYTTLSAFALAHWDNYLLTGRASHLEKLLAVADYMLATADRRESGFVRLRAERPNAGHVGELSAMFQGESMSVLCRAWQATGQERYLNGAMGLFGVFELPVERDGVLGYISRIGAPWYEENVALPLRHILNGMVYALWGLRDLFLVCEDRRAGRLFEDGGVALSQHCGITTVGSGAGIGWLRAVPRILSP